MGRASKADAQKHRDEVVTAAARMFRERGIGAVSVPELMAAAGLTHGGFYRHFPSKDALAATAVSAAFAEQVAWTKAIFERHQGDPEAGHAEIVDVYLSTDHRDQPGTGCAHAGLAIDASHTSTDSGVREAFAAGMRETVDTLATSGGQTRESKARREAALVELATLVGGMVLARATAGEEISDQVLAAVRKSLAQT
ncbi:TetR/AcrR family transcriptional regulator [Actinopolymorpha pittospori]|uniref:TetR/AcrR family transcriptional repressor of nem operon n=1 Tax=Actinopolymorpha pittospori TaxID=648752 RepID=A0A927N8M6_9ACTN|nr:TetR/AcrR family transcriptional regulator [Actinopolymorpha pittospori]MBE1612238.1 TetR/AcrR family transcriptional repressor of nem operon [Actinopolymorpha pittospori]